MERDRREVDRIREDKSLREAIGGGLQRGERQGGVNVRVCETDTLLFVAKAQLTVDLIHCFTITDLL